MKLQLYIAGSSRPSQTAVEQAQALCQAMPGTDLEIIDITAEPESAERNHVIATPTLVRVDPAPERRIVGDIGNLGDVVSYLTHK